MGVWIIRATDILVLVREQTQYRFFKCEKQERPGRDLNPGQKIRNLLGCPLPYRDPINYRFR